MSVHNVNWDPALLDSILASLAKAGLYERAGELYEHMSRSSEAMQSYRRGHAYRKAIDLARREFPAEVGWGGSGGREGFARGLWA